MFSPLQNYVASGKATFTSTEWYARLTTDMSFMLDYSYSLGDYKYILQVCSSISVSSAHHHDNDTRERMMDMPT